VCGSCAMTQYRIWPHRQDPCRPYAVGSEDPMPDRVHAAVQDVQAPGAEPMPDRRAAPAGFDQLPSRNHPVLPLRKSCDQHIKAVTVS
jgi:hypothetical protein